MTEKSITSPIGKLDPGYDTLKRDELFNQITKMVSDVSSNNQDASFSQSDIFELINKMHYDQSKAVKNDTNTINGLNDLSKESLDGFLRQMGDLQNNPELVSFYKDIDDIIYFIPEAQTVIDTYLDSLTSPEDFSSEHDILNISYINNTIDTNNQIMSFFSNFYKKYKFNEYVIKIVRSVLKYGKAYLLIDTLDNIKEDALFKSPNQVPEVNLFHENMDEYKDEFDINSYLAEKEEEGDVFINTENNNVQQIFEHMFSFDDASQILLEGTDEFLHTQSDLILKVLDIDRVIPIKNDSGFCYGYLYVGNKIYNTSYQNNNDVMNPTNSNALYKDRNIINRDSVLKGIVGMFERYVYKQLDKEFLANSSNNSKFYSVINNLIQDKNDFNNRFAVKFFRTTNVQEFGNGLESIFEKSMFIAKVYIGCLASNFLQRIASLPDKRVIYVDMGLKRDVAGSIQKLIHNFKKMDYKLSDMTTISSINQKIGIRQDMFIPVANGKKPIEIETLPEKQIGYQDDFMNEMKKIFINSTKTPAAFIDSTSEVEFARILTMQNAIYAKHVMIKRNILNTEFKAGMEKIFRVVSKCGSEVADATKVTNEAAARRKNVGRRKPDSAGNRKNGVGELLKSFDPNFLKVTLPMPTSLLITSFQEKLDPTTGAISNLAKFYFTPEDGNSVEDLPEYKEFCKLMLRKLIPSFDWDDIDQTVQKAIDVANLKKIEKANSSDSSSTDFSSGDTGEGGDEDNGDNGGDDLGL